MLRHKIALITGGTKGIGKSIVKEFLKNGAYVIFTYSKDEKTAMAFKRKLDLEFSGKFEMHKGSIIDVDFTKELLSKVKVQWNKLDILVNNAGITQDGLFLEMSKQAWSEVIKTNVFGTLNFSLQAFELLKKQDQSFSKIINLSSISGLFGRSGQTNYSCSKGAIIGITKLLAKKFKTSNIQVHTLAPGLISTEMLSSLHEDKYDEVIKATIAKRVGKPGEVAKAATFLASESASYMSGACIRVDGGFLK